MPGKRKMKASGARDGAQRATVQTTLKDIFQRTNSVASSSTEKSQDSQLEFTVPITPPPPPAPPSRPPKPSQLFPIFSRASSAREKARGTVLSVDDIDVIDISSHTELSTEPQLSPGSSLTPLSESIQATSHSRVSSATLDDHGCEDDTNPRHARIPERQSTKIKGSNKRTLGSGDVAPFPSSCSQHVRGLQCSYSFSQAPMKRTKFPTPRISDEGPPAFLAKWKQVDDTPSTPPFRISQSLTSQQCKERLHSFGHIYSESHPVFARISIHQERIPETWTRRFRPRRADEVLGNERHALYLRDWLGALELRSQGGLSDGATSRENKEKGKSKRGSRGVKRPRVIRAVAKRGNKKRRIDSDDDLDDFVVWSEEDGEQVDETPGDSDDDFTFCQQAFDECETADTDESHAVRDDICTATNHAVSRSQGPVHTSLTDKLTNTLLITGPPGCGKTAAVYACAEELGWDVFEVYPGIGKRNGASLEQLVGDVGKNHIVQTVHRRGRTERGREGPKERVGLNGYLNRGESKLEGSGTQGQPIEIEDAPTEAQPPCGRRVVRQSLVLLEEVDILFKEDAGFWPAVIEFIRNCQRPVVMTCNDAGLVPVGELPLQSILVFEPCPSQVAANFLGCLALTEGLHVRHEDLVGLYESTQCVDGMDMPDAPLYPRRDPLPFPDLRRTMMQLEILCAGTRERGEDEEARDDRGSGRAISADERWVEMKRNSEVMSHMDAQVRFVGTGEVVEDEEAGYVVLGEVDEGSRGVHEGTGPMEASIREAFRARVAYQTRMVDALQGILGPGGAMVPQTGVFLDYIPFARLIEDGLARGGGGGGGRRTRNSMGVRIRRGVPGGLGGYFTESGS